MEYNAIHWGDTASVLTAFLSSWSMSWVCAMRRRSIIQGNIEKSTAVPTVHSLVPKYETFVG